MPPIKKIASQIAGGTLGYIGGNIPGAVAGATAAGAAYDRYYPSPAKTPTKMAMKRKRTGGRKTAYKKRKLNTRSKWTVKTQDSGVTRQSDQKTQYVKKSMPRYKKKQWGAFTKRVQAVMLKQQATTTVLYNTQLQQNLPTGGGNLIFITHLYGRQGVQSANQEVGNRDMWSMAKNDNRLLTYVSDTTSYTNPGKALFKSAVLDVTFRNNSADSVECDVYKLVYNRESDHPNLTNAITSIETHTDKIPGSGAAQITLGDRGATLFELPNLLSDFNMKILSKKKYFVESKQSFTLQHRDPGNFKMDVSEFEDLSADASQGYIKKGQTITFFFVVKKITGVVFGLDAPKEIAIGITRKYCYSVLSANDRAYDSYNPNL